MRILDLKIGDKIIYKSEEHVIGIATDEIVAIKTIDNRCISIRGCIGINFSDLCKYYKFVHENGDLEDITSGLEYIDFLVASRHLGYICYRMGMELEYNLVATDKQIKEYKKDLIYNECFPELEFDEIFKKENKDRPDITSRDMIEELRYVYIINKFIYKNFSVIWGKKLEFDKDEFIVQSVRCIECCYEYVGNINIIREDELRLIMKKEFTKIYDEIFK